MAIQYIDQADIDGKRVLARFDFNVPLSKEDGKTITDTTRIDMALETIKYILAKNPSKLILMSHLGRPKGVADKSLSLEPVAEYLADKLGEDITLSESALDSGIKTLLGLKHNKIILLENIRFHKEETEGNDEFAKTLASYGDVFVHDAFGTAHRKHASTYNVIKYFKNKSYGGFLLKQEVEALTKVAQSPTKPFVAIVGGAKISDKIKIIEKLLSSVDSLLIGGAMAYPFLKAQGHQIGKSLCQDEDVALAKRILATSYKSKLVLPTDHIVSKEFGGAPVECENTDIEDSMMGLDIGPKTIDLYKNKLASAKTVLWNGPMGLFENKDFANGTMAMARVLSELDAFTLVGGGDSVSAVKKSGLAQKMSHVSTGGGASLEFIENGTLPGIQALKHGVS